MVLSRGWSLLAPVLATMVSPRLEAQDNGRLGNSKKYIREVDRIFEVPPTP